MKYALCTNKCHLSINLSCININWRPPTITINITLPLPILNFQIIESQVTSLNIELNWNILNLRSPGPRPSSPLLSNCRHLGLADTVAIVSLVALVAPWACCHHRCCCCCTCSPPTCKVYTCSASCLHCQWSRSRRQQKTEASFSEPLLSSTELSTVV